MLSRQMFKIPLEGLDLLPSMDYHLWKEACLQLNQSVENIASGQESLDANKRSLLEQISAYRRAKNQRGIELKCLVDEQCSQLISKLVEFKNEESKKNHTRRDELDCQLMMLSSLRERLEELLEKGSACDISQRVKDLLLARAKQVHAEQVEFSKGKLSQGRVAFESANIADITSGKMALIGWISVNGEGMPQIQPTVGELESNLSETQQQLTQLRERVLSLEASNKQLPQQAKADKAQYETELTKMQEKQSDDVNTAAVRCKEELTSFQDHLHKATNETATLKNKLSDAEKHAANLAYKLNKADTQIASLTEKVKRNDEEAASLQQRLKKKDAHSTRLLEQVLLIDRNNPGLVEALRNCGLESFLVVVGLGNRHTVSQRVSHISLEHPDRVSSIDSTPAYVDWGVAACVMGNNLYVVAIGDAYNELRKWNVASDWTRCADMTSYRRYHCSAVVDSALYALGGWADADAKMQSSVEAYHTQTNQWSAAGQLMHAVSVAACVSYKNSIYVFGGRDTKQEAVAHVQVYDAAQHKCTLLHNAMPRAYGGMRAVVWQTHAVLLGHETGFLYNFETEMWQERASFKIHVGHFGLTVDNQTLYIVGGGLSRPTANVRSVSVRDVIEDNQEARWRHHVTLPQPARVHVFSPVPLYRELI